MNSQVQRSSGTFLLPPQTWWFTKQGLLGMAGLRGEICSLQENAALPLLRGETFSFCLVVESWDVFCIPVASMGTIEVWQVVFRKAEWLILELSV